MILVGIEKFVGDCQIKGFEYCFAAESFGFGVERDLKDSAKAGTADVNIGVGEFQDCTISKSMDSASSLLAKRAISGASVGKVDIFFVETVTIDEKIFNVCYLQYHLDNAFIKSWTTTGDNDERPSEDVAIWYNKIAFAYWATKDGKTFTPAGEVKWDQTKAKEWTDCPKFDLKKIAAD